VAQEKQPDGKKLTATPLKRRSLLTFGAKLGVGLVGTAFVLARSGLTIAGTPSIENDDLPSEPTLMGSLLYWGILMPRKYLQPAQTFLQMRAQNQETVQEPAGVSVEHISAGGVPSTLYRAPGASNNRFILYLHGGGLVLPISNTHRSLCAQLSQATGTSVLLPTYRLAPEHPYPAPLDDCLAAYHWIREQGVQPSQIIISGESGGGYLTLASALMLRDQGEPLPAALVPISAALLEPTFSGPSYTTKAVVDPAVTLDLAKESLAAYTNNGKIDARNPLISLNYADLHKLPPTLIQVGSQEVFLSDNINFAHRAQDAGVSVQLEVWPGMWHAFPILVGTLPIPDATLAFQHIVKYIRQHLER
jgi:acetyl esterase/lipase